VLRERNQMGQVRVMLHSLAFGTLKLFVADPMKEAVTKAQMDMTLDVMAHSLIYWAQELVGRGLMGRGGRIYAMTSSGGARVLPHYGPVSAAKAALESNIRQLASELDFPISAHGEYRQRRFHPFRQLEGERRGDTELALRGLDHALGFPCDNMTTLGHFIFTGILERFPKLRLAILESNAGWLPFWLGRMDDHTHGRNSVMGKSENLRMLPSEYFMRQCVISCDSDERALKYVVQDLNAENIVWNTDYPHPDAIDPKRALPDLDAQPISNEAKRKILWDNAIKLFGPRISN